jgi:hypothetical protein
VTKPIDNPPLEQQWLVSFTSLRSNIEPLPPIRVINPATLVGGVGVFLTAAITRIGSSLPFYNVTISGGATSTSKFKFSWGELGVIGTFDPTKPTSDEDIIKAFTAAGMDYVVAERYRPQEINNGDVTWLFMMVPRIKSGQTIHSLVTYLSTPGLLNVTEVGGSGTAIAVNLINVTHPIVPDGGKLQVSLGNIGCTETIQGVFCSPTLPTELSKAVSVADATAADVKEMLESLRSIKNVQVTAQSFGQGDSPNGYVLSGRRFDVTLQRCSTLLRVLAFGRRKWSMISSRRSATCVARSRSIPSRI